MHHPLRALLSLTSLLWLAPAVWAQEQPLRLAVVVGNNVGLQGEEPLQYAEAEALALYELLIEIGDLKAGAGYLALGKSASELEELLSQVAKRIDDAAREREVVLLFYYSGHASEEALHLGGTRLPLDRLRQLLTGRACTVVAFVDACQSGALFRPKGTRLLPPYEIHLDRPATATGHVFITSSSAAEVSLEADELHGSIFSHYLISGLRGDADSDGDGRVDLAELYRYTYHSTLTKSAEARSGAQHPSYEYNLSGSGGIVISWPDRSDTALELGPGQGGEYLVVTKYGRRVVAEVTLGPDDHRRIALPSQSYTVKKRTTDGFLVGEINLTWGGTRKLDDAELRFEPFATVAAKGELPPDHHEILVGLRLRNGVVSGNDLLLGTQLSYHYRLNLPLKLGLSLDLHQGDTRTREQLLLTRGLELFAEALYPIALGSTQIQLGTAVGPSLHWQEIPDWKRRHSLGLAGVLIAEGLWVPADPLTLSIGLRGGVDLLDRDGGYRFGPLLAVTVGAGASF